MVVSGARLVGSELSLETEEKELLHGGGHGGQEDELACGVPWGWGRCWRRGTPARGSPRRGAGHGLGWVLGKNSGQGQAHGERLDQEEEQRAVVFWVAVGERKFWVSYCFTVRDLYGRMGVYFGSPLLEIV